MPQLRCRKEAVFRAQKNRYDSNFTNGDMLAKVRIRISALVGSVSRSMSRYLLPNQSQITRTLHGPMKYLHPRLFQNTWTVHCASELQSISRHCKNAYSTLFERGQHFYYALEITSVFKLLFRARLSQLVSQFIQ